MAESGSSFHALVMEGDPGIRKNTTLCRVRGPTWPEGQGLTVLSCNPVEADTKLAFAALGDLLAPLTDDLVFVAELPAPQRVALEVVALLRAPAASGRAEDVRRALGMALQSRCSAAWPRSAPVLVVIDDVQWLDRASAAAVAFACRRLPDCPVRLLVAATARAPAAAMRYWGSGEPCQGRWSG